MKKDWIKVENFLDKDMTNLLYKHALNANKRFNFLKSFGINVNTFGDLYGNDEDDQALGDHSCYGDLIFDTLLEEKRNEFENITDTELVSQYSYYRTYTNGTELERHIDRESCEMSATFCLGYDSDYSWPIWFKDSSDNEIAVEMQPGDLVIYNGTKLEHWREPFKGNHHSQLFFHYTKKDGQYDKKFDGRPELGLPASKILNEWITNMGNSAQVPVQVREISI